MSRIERLKQCANPGRRGNWDGESTEKNIERWSERATKNSDGHLHRAKGVVDLGSAHEPYTDPPKEHDTGRRMNLRSSEMKPLARHSIDARMQAKKDLNHVASESDYMASVRRITS